MVSLKILGSLATRGVGLSFYFVNHVGICKIASFDVRSSGSYVSRTKSTNVMAGWSFTQKNKGRVYYTLLGSGTFQYPSSNNGFGSGLQEVEFDDPMVRIKKRILMDERSDYNDNNCNQFIDSIRDKIRLSKLDVASVDRLRRQEKEHHLQVERARLKKALKTQTAILTTAGVALGVTAGVVGTLAYQKGDATQNSSCALI